MSLQSEITRIENAKADIKTAIEEKGVSVPDGTMLDGMAALIGNITAGSGGGGEAVAPYLEQVKTGSFTGSGETGKVIAHYFGKTPKMAMAIKGAGTYGANQIMVLINILTAENEVVVISGYIGSTTTTFGVSGPTTSTAEWNDTTIKLVTTSTTYKFASGKTFKYYIYA